MNFTTKISVTLLLSALLLLTGGCREQAAIEPALAEREPLKVETLRVQQSSSVEQSAEYSGRLRAAQRTEVGFLRGGRVDNLLVDEGRRVQQGDLLAVLDTRGLKAREGELLSRLSSAQAALSEIEAGPRAYQKAAAVNAVKEAESRLTLARQKLERRRVLFEEGAVPREQVDELESQEQSLLNQLRAAQNQVKDLDSGSRPQTRAVGRAQVEEVRASLDALQVELTDSRLHAPYSGTIARRLLDEGSIVSAGQPVYELVTDTKLEVELYLPPEKIRELAIGKVVEVLSGAEKHSARVVQVLPKVDPQSGTQPVLLEVLNSHNLKPGQLVRLPIQTSGSEEGYWLPSTSLIPGERGLFVCYTVVPIEGEKAIFEVKKQAVELIDTDGEQAFVRGTLTGSPEVLVGGVQRVVPGQRVRK